LDGVTPGSSCFANAYTNNHERLEKEKLGIFTRIYLHIVDAVGMVHAIILRAQALLYPIKTLVLGGHRRPPPTTKISCGPGRRPYHVSVRAIVALQ
jgi:hypothetical protein